MKIIARKNIWFAVSGLFVLTSVLLWIAFGLKPGIDFTGGSLMEVTYHNVERPERTEIQSRLSDLGMNFAVSATEDNGYILRFQNVDEETHQEVLNRLAPEMVEGEIADGESPGLEELRFDSIGPTVGRELQERSLSAMAAVLIAIVLYIAYAFRKVSYPVSSWKYGIVALITLFHDILITIGVFVLLGYLLGWEVNTPFIAALLTILGYSVNDTIVVFDRIRENLHRYEGSFEEVVERSVNETMVRSLNTSFTTLLVLGVVFVLGGVSIRDFVLALMIGIAVGAYSSIFVASPLLVLWQQVSWKLKKGKA